MESRPPTDRGWLTPKRVAVSSVIAAILAAVVLLWFEPQKLFIDETVDEAAPGAVATPTVRRTGDPPGQEKDEREVALAGDFRSIDHETSGTAMLTRASDGRHYLRLEDFRTENGPDLFVYLSGAPATAEGLEFAEVFVDLGELKGNIGNQNYVVPDGTDLERYRSVVIWCRRFTSPFGAAPLEMQ